MRVLMALIPLLLLAACVPEGQPRLHEIVLYGAENARISYLYGAPTSLMLGEREIALERGSAESADPLALAEALAIDGEPYLREAVAPLGAPPTQVSPLARSSDLLVRVFEDTGPIVYYDGRMWFTLLGDGREGMNTRVVPRPRIGALRGVGDLTRAEADALSAYLEEKGPVAVTLLDQIPARRRSADGVEEYLRTGLFLQTDFDVSTASQPRRQRQEVVWEVMAQGNQAVGFEQQSFFLVRDQATLLSLWNRAHGSQLQVPPVPDADFSRETVVALFLGTKPTGGYAIEVERVSLVDGDLFIDVAIREPGAGAITTQAITSPWVMVRILRGGIDTAWIREAGSERLIGAAVPSL
ncbi:MAG TPA: protease complex subunit PrcB family protein [Trueperaceae bacterium]